MQHLREKVRIGLEVVWKGYCAIQQDLNTKSPGHHLTTSRKRQPHWTTAETRSEGASTFVRFSLGCQEGLSGPSTVCNCVYGPWIPAYAGMTFWKGIQRLGSLPSARMKSVPGTASCSTIAFQGSDRWGLSQPCQPLVRAPVIKRSGRRLWRHWRVDFKTRETLEIGAIEGVEPRNPIPQHRSHELGIEDLTAGDGMLAKQRDPSVNHI